MGGEASYPRHWRDTNLAVMFTQTRGIDRALANLAGAVFHGCRPGRSAPGLNLRDLISRASLFGGVPDVASA